METLSVPEARRLALARAGFLPSSSVRFPAGATRRSCYAWLRRLGYLQLDTINVAGARSHTLALLSRVKGLDPGATDLLRPGAPVFEYWGHEASWIAMDLYPLFGFRRRDCRRNHPWWGPLLKEHRAQARVIERRVRDEGPLRSADFEDRSPRSDWGFTVTKRLLHALWSAGTLAIRARPGFHRLYDLTERVIPEPMRRARVPRRAAIEALVLKALELHGWAELRTLAQQWRVGAKETREALGALELRGSILPCRLLPEAGAAKNGWVRPKDLDLAARLGRGPLHVDDTDAVPLTPFDVLLWDRARVATLFGFEQILEVYKPRAKRKYGYFCMPVLSGESLVARCDLKADRSRGVLRVLSTRAEPGRGAQARRAVPEALTRLAASLELVADDTSIRK